MDKFVEKFNIFDLFTMLIPGIVISTLFCISLSFKYYETWSKWGNEKYVVFFILSYLCGVIYQELGTILDKWFLYDMLYGGNPKETFLIKGLCEKIYVNNNLYYDAKRVESSIINMFKLQTKDIEPKKYNRFLEFIKKIKYKIFIRKNIKANFKNRKEFEKEKLINTYIFSYCLNMSEMNNLTSKSDKMGALSEMSRSLFWGCVSIFFMNITMILILDPSHLKFYGFENILLFIIGTIFLLRKIRYERYRIHILLRAMIVYLTDNKLLNTD